jgi:hypothetical protein
MHMDEVSLTGHMFIRKDIKTFLPRLVSVNEVT